MQNFFKGKIATAIILIATFVLAGVAIFTAIRLYQLRSQPVAPNVPSSLPRAQEVATPPASSCSLAFTLSQTIPTATPTGTAAPTITPTPTGTGTSTATPTSTGAPNTCNGTCGSNSNCASNYVCYNGFCRNPSCTGSQNCVCAGTPAPTVAPTPTAPTLPQSGTSWPTTLGIGIGILTIIGSLLLAL